MKEVFSLLEKYERLSSGLVEYLESKLKHATFRRSEIYLREGQICRNIYFIVKGVSRVSERKENGEYCYWLQQEGELVTSVNSFLEQTPSAEILICEERLTVVYITFSEFEEASALWPEFASIRRKLFEEYYRRQNAWKSWVKSTPKADRYGRFLQEQRVLASRVTDKVLASYLDIDYSYLKKMKKALRDKLKK